MVVMPMRIFLVLFLLICPLWSDALNSRDSHLDQWARIKKLSDLNQSNLKAARMMAESGESLPILLEGCSSDQKVTSCPAKSDCEVKTDCDEKQACEVKTDCAKTSCKSSDSCDEKAGGLVKNTWMKVKTWFKN